MNKLLVLVGTALSLSAFGATTFTLKSDLSGQEFDWTAGVNYVGDPAQGPVANDTIIIPENMTAVVNAAAAADKGTCGICNIYISAGGTLQVLQGEGATTRKHNTYVLTISGPGTVAQVGTLVEDLYIKKSCVFDGVFTGAMNIKILNGVTFRMNNPDQHYSGSPLFTDTSTFEFARLEPESGTGHFYGSGGNFNLTADSTIRYVGAEGLYETMSRSAYLNHWTTFDTGDFGGLTMSCYLKNNYSNTASPQYQRTVVITGNNAVESIFSPTTFGGDAKDDAVPIYLIKEGTGTWKFVKNAGLKDPGFGVVDVRNGTVKFNTMSERGVNCDVGFQSQLYNAPTARSKSVAMTDANKVDYAFILGSTNATTEGVLRYTGTEPLDFTTRPLAVRSKGRIIADTASVTIDGATAEGKLDKSLTLVTAAGTENFATHIDSGTTSGKFDLIKEGTGNLSLSGTNDFTGNLIAKGGKIKLRSSVDPNVKYRWFRFTVKENGYGCPSYDTEYSVGQESSGEPKAISDSEKSYLQITEIALYDRTGAVLTSGLQRRGTELSLADDFYDAAEGYAGLEPGRVGLDSRVGTDSKVNSVNNSLQVLFDGNNSAIQLSTENARTGHGIDIDDPTTWVSFVFRLPESAPDPAFFDVAPGRNREGVGSYNGRNLKSYRLEMSGDGRNWINAFDDQDDLTIPEYYPHWVSEPTVTVNYGTRSGKGVMFEIPDWELYPKDTPFTWFRFTVMQNGYACPTYDTSDSLPHDASGNKQVPGAAEMGRVQIDEIALYDKDGNNLTSGKLAQKATTTSLLEDKYDPATGYAGLEPGYCGIDSRAGTVGATVSQAVIALFDKSNNAMSMSMSCAQGGKGITLDDESTWVSYVWRLPEGSAEAAYFDIAPGRNRFYYGSSTTESAGSYVGRNVKAFRLEGSPDGVHWFKVIDDQLDITIPEYHPHWMTEPTGTMTYNARTTGKLAFLEREGAPDVYAFTGVGASNGGSIEMTGSLAQPISKLMLDAASLPGTISGLSLMPSGILEIANLGDAKFSFNGLLNGFKNGSNISNWSLKVDGESSTRKIRVTDDGTVTIGPAASGLSILIK